MCVNIFLIPFIAVGVIVVPLIIVNTLKTAEGAEITVVLFLLFWEAIWLTGVCGMYRGTTSLLFWGDVDEYEE